MPLVTITGNVTDHGQEPLPAALQQRVWFVPNGGHFPAGGAAMDGQPVLATFSASSGEFEARVWSTLDESMWYTLRTDWLIPGQESAPSDERARGYFEWTGMRIYPDTGGKVADLVQAVYGTGTVWCAPNVPDLSKRTQLQLDTDTGDLYERRITW